MTDRPLVVDIVELRRRTGSCRDLVASVGLEGLEVGESRVRDGEIDVDLVIEAVTEGLVARGTLEFVARAPCRRCLVDVDTPIVVEVHEVFETEPTEGETWPIDDERIDLGPVVREAAMLALPLASLCRDDCAGPAPDRFPTGPVDPAEPSRDPRWDVLDELELD